MPKYGGQPSTWPEGSDEYLSGQLRYAGIRDIVALGISVFAFYNGYDYDQIYALYTIHMIHISNTKEKKNC